ncbi:hypothetical protein TNCV_947561 [Trichonephila clavipes]|nr:hypothetical protein TNCV_947561 [Trichonephila clavipes]
MADKDILEFVQRLKNIIDADFDHENEMNDAAPVPTSSEMRNVLKGMRSYLDAHSKGEMNNKMDDIEQFVATRGLLATDPLILNHDQVTWTTPELAPPSPNYHTTSTGGRFSSR